VSAEGEHRARNAGDGRELVVGPLGTVFMPAVWTGMGTRSRNPFALGLSEYRRDRFRVARTA
jgi:hypothetical protein